MDKWIHETELQGFIFKKNILLLFGSKLHQIFLSPLWIAWYYIDGPENCKNPLWRKFRKENAPACVLKYLHLLCFNLYIDLSQFKKDLEPSIWDISKFSPFLTPTPFRQHFFCHYQRKIWQIFYPLKNWSKQFVEIFV